MYFRRQIIIYLLLIIQNIIIICNLFHTILFRAIHEPTIQIDWSAFLENAYTYTFLFQVLIVFVQANERLSLSIMSIRFI